MAENIRSRCDVVIAGVGIAAAIAALRLLSFGFRPLMLHRRGASKPGAEALPKRAVQLFEALGLGTLLTDAGAVAVENFETTWGDKAPIKKQEWLAHVDRLALARLAVAEAVKRGAVLRDCPHLPRLESDADAVKVRLGDRDQQFFAALDATGRSARWSRPVSRAGRRVADVFIMPRAGAGLRGKVATVKQGWAYRIDLPDSTTVGIVTEHGLPRKRIDDEVASRLGLPGVESSYIGRRPAFPQWAAEPVTRNKVSIGDAALAHDPIAGQGVRFALGSALAAAAVIRTWREVPQNRELANSYYLELVEAEKRKHLSLSEALYGPPEGAGTERRGPSDSGAAELPRAVRFIAPTRTAGLQHDGLIIRGEAIILKNGDAVRWLGKFDLLSLKKFCSATTPLETLLERLPPERCTQRERVMLIRWCLRNDVLMAEG